MSGSSPAARDIWDVASLVFSSGRPAARRRRPRAVFGSTAATVTFLARRSPHRPAAGALPSPKPAAE